MDITGVKESLRRTLAGSLDVYERRPGKYQLIVPIRHEDGDMVDTGWPPRRGPYSHL